MIQNNFGKRNWMKRTTPKQKWEKKFYLLLFGFLLINSSIYGSTNNLVQNLTKQTTVTLSQHKDIIHGVVCSKDTQKPIDFATVSIKNTTIGTFTDSLGHFTLRATIKPSTHLIISHLSFQKQEIVLSSGSNLKQMKIMLVPKEILLSDVVVSAGLYEQTMDKLTTSAHVISNRTILDNMNSNLTDMLNKTPGFTQVWEYHSPIILRGLNSNRLIIMADGNRRIGTFPGGYFGQDLNIYGAKKIEIIKGPGSVIYGSGAISGIINLISGTPFGPKLNKIQVHTGYGSNNNEFLELVKLCHKTEKFGISVQGKFRKTDDMKYGGGDIADNSSVEDKDLALTTGYKFSDAHTLILNTSYHHGDWGKARGFNGPTKAFTKIRNEEESTHADLSYTYTPQINATASGQDQQALPSQSQGLIKSIHAQVYFDHGRRDYYQYAYSTITNHLSTLSLVHYKNNYGGTRFYTVLNGGRNNTLTTGIDGYYSRINSPSETYDYYDQSSGTIAGADNSGQENLGIFINDTWHPYKFLKLVSGVRYDDARVVEGDQDVEGEQTSNSGQTAHREAFSGNFGMVYSPKDQMHLSFNIGRAFRMPTTEELFTTTISCKGTKAGNPDLNPEYSWNYDLGFRGHTLHQKFKYDFALFYNILDDFINEAPSNDMGIDFTLENTEATLLGGEFALSYRFDHIGRPYNSLFVGTGGSYVYGEDCSEEKKTPLFGMPPFKINTNITYKGVIHYTWLTDYSIKLEHEYAAEQNRVAEIPEGTDGGPWGYVASQAHNIFNISLGLNSNVLPGMPKIRLMVNNIFDTNYQPFGSYIPAMGRNMKVIVSLTL